MNSKTGSDSRALAREARVEEHRGLENLVIFASKKFSFWQNLSFVPKSTASYKPGWNSGILRTRAFWRYIDRMATHTFRNKSNNKAESFFSLNFNVYTDVTWITEKELEREIKKPKRDKEEKH